MGVTATIDAALVTRAQDGELGDLGSGLGFASNFLYDFGLGSVYTLKLYYTIIVKVVQPFSVNTIISI